MGYLYLLPAMGMAVLFILSFKETVSPKEEKNRFFILFEKVVTFLCRGRRIAYRVEKWIASTELQLKAVYPMKDTALMARKKCFRLMAQILMLIFFGSLLSFTAYCISEKQAAVSGLARNEAGQGNRIYELEADIEGIKKHFSVSVSERTYSSRERNQWFQYAKENISTLILGENASLDEVSSDLNLIHSIPGSAINVEWESDNPLLIQPSGELNQDRLTEDENNVRLTAVFTYDGYSERYDLDITVRKKSYQGIEGSFDLLQDKIQKEEAAETAGETYFLPTEVEGKKVSYRIQQTDAGTVIMVLTLLLVLLLPLEEKSLMDKARKKRDLQMLIDYPELVCSLSLFMGAGMNISRAWERIALSYIEEMAHSDRKQSCCYDEVVSTYRQLQSGMQKSRAFEAFGNRCALAPYKKLGMLIISNIRKGTADLSDLLKTESVEAMAERKRAAIKKSEEASEKLILPMALELLIVMGIMVVPAFMSINI